MSMACWVVLPGPLGKLSSKSFLISTRVETEGSRIPGLDLEGQTEGQLGEEQSRPVQAGRVVSSKLGGGWVSAARGTGRVGQGTARTLTLLQ